MASGQQTAELNYLSFTAWKASKTDDDFRSMVSRGVLARQEIADECGFAKSALNQNPRIKRELGLLEVDLRARGVLPPLVEKAGDEPTEPPIRDASGRRAAQDAERLKRLEQENASLRAEVSELKEALSRYSVLREALATTGRLPR